MNELEKGGSAQEPLNTESNASSQEQAKLPETPAPAETPATPETATEVDNNETAQEASEEAAKRYHEMTKDQLLQSLRNILASADMKAHRDVAAIKQAFFIIRGKEVDKQLADYLDAGNPADAFASIPDPAENEFKELLSQFKEQRNAYLEAEEARRKENLDLKLKILDQLKEIVEDIDNINLHFSKFQQLQQDFKSIKEIPASSETETWKDYQNVTELFYDRLKMNKELRDLDFRKNLEAKRALIQEAEKLQEEADVIAAFRKLQDLHAQWREIGPVAKEIRESIWDEFKAISTSINKRHQEYFEGRKANEQANEEAKTKLCEEIEAIDKEQLKNFNAWDQATNKIKELQAQWKELGFASRKANNALYNRFRKACDDFFAAKADYFKATKDEFAANLAKKVALCEAAEALKDSENNNAALEKVRELQKQWKEIGSVARKQSDAIWNRFQTACNVFFDERKKQRTEQRREETANLDAKKEVIAKLKALVEEGRDDVIQQVRDLQAEWQNIGHVPFRVKDKLFAEYREMCDALYGRFNSNRSRNRMNNFTQRMEGLKGDGKLGSERDRLQRACDQKQSELQTIENNMGFFKVKSSSGNSMVAEMERKIVRIKEEIAELKQKIRLLDENLEG